MLEKKKKCTDIGKLESADINKCKRNLLEWNIETELHLCRSQYNILKEERNGVEYQKLYTRAEGIEIEIRRHRDIKIGRCRNKI